MRVEDTDDVVIEDLTGDTSSDLGIKIVNRGGFAIRRNKLSGGGNIDIRGSGPSQLRGVIEENTVLDAGVWGIYVEAGESPVTVRQNIVERAGFRGIQVSQGTSCVIEGNKVRESTNEGIHVSLPKGCRVSGNVVTYSGQDGINFVVAEGCLVTDNVSSHNTGSGLNIDGWSLIVGNTLNLNGGAGLLLGNPNNVFGRNMARGNGGTGVSCQPATGGLIPPDWCDVSVDNDSMGGNMMPGPPPS